MKNLFDKIFSLEEAKISALVIVFIISSGFSLYMYYVNGDISSNLLTFLTSLVFTIGGVNATNYVSRVFKSKSKTSVTSADEMELQKEFENRPTI